MTRANNSQKVVHLGVSLRLANRVRGRCLSLPRDVVPLDGEASEIHFILRERPCLVAEDIRNISELLEQVRVLHDRVLVQEWTIHFIVMREYPALRNLHHDDRHVQRYGNNVVEENEEDEELFEIQR